MRLTAICLMIPLGILIVGCFSRGTLTRPNSQITIFDVQLAFPMRDYHRKGMVISAAQANKLKEFYGQEVFKTGETLVYYTVKPLKHRGRALQLLGEVIKIEGEEIGVLVGLRKGTIKDVSLRKGDAVKAFPGMEEFLSQFVRKDMGSSFELVIRPEDLLALPFKLKPIPGYRVASKRLADLLQKMVVIAEVLRL